MNGLFKNLPIFGDNPGLSIGILKLAQSFICSFVFVAGISLLSACTTTGGVFNSVGTGAGGSVSNAATSLLQQSIIQPGVARQLDRQSRISALEAEQTALENGKAGQVTNWQGKGGITGEVIPEQTYQVGSQNCRRYSHTVTINSQAFPNSGTACRSPNGQWSPLT